MRVFIAGGTGAIGKHALKAVVEAGHNVSAMVRSEEKAVSVTLSGATPVNVSLFDREALKVELNGFDAVVNLATAIPASSDFLKASAFNKNHKVRCEGSTNLVDAAIEAGVPRFIQESVSMIYKDSGNSWIDESFETAHFPFAMGNHTAEANANRFTNKNRIGVVLRFGWFYGPGATHSEEFMGLALKRRICVMMGRRNSYLSSIHVQDAGRAVLAALDAPAGTYNIVDDEPLTKQEYADALAAAVGRKAWLRFPGKLALLFGNTTVGLTNSLRVSNKRFKKETGWYPLYPSAREGWKATFNELYSQ